LIGCRAGFDVVETRLLACRVGRPRVLGVGGIVGAGG